MMNEMNEVIFANNDHLVTSPADGGVRSQGRKARCPATPTTYSVSSAGNYIEYMNILELCIFDNFPSYSHL